MIVFIIPVFNEIRFLPEVICSIDAISKAQNIKIFVDDGSNDGSLEYLENLKREDFVILKNKKNKGMGKALKKAFNYIIQCNSINENSIIVTIDGDNQHDISMLNDYIDFFEEKKLDLMLIKRRFDKYPFHKRAGNYILSRVTSWLTSYKFYDVECGFRIMKKKDISELLEHFIGNRYSCAQEIAIIFALSEKNIDNSFFCDIKHYRSNTSVYDFINNIFIAFRTYYKLKRKGRIL